MGEGDISADGPATGACDRTDRDAADHSKRRNAGVTLDNLETRIRLQDEGIDDRYAVTDQTGGKNVEPRIEERTAMRVVGMGTRFISVMVPERTNFKAIPQLWHEFEQRRKEIAAASTADAPGGWRSYGLVEQLPAEGKRHPMEMYYLACVEAAAGSGVPAGMEERVVAAGNWAVFTHRGPVKKLGETMEFIFKKWLPGSGMTMRKGPQIEVYDGRFAMESEGSEMEILVPIEA